MPQTSRAKQTVILILAALALSSCAGSEGSLSSTTGVLQCVQQVTEDRDYVPSLETIGNESTTDSIRILSVNLDGGKGIELVAAFSVTRDSQVAGYVPPRPGEYGSPENDADVRARWEKRVPISDTIVEPGDMLSLLLVLRRTGHDICLYTTGYTIKYEQYGRKYSQHATSSIVFYDGDDSAVCQDIIDDILGSW